MAKGKVTMVEEEEPASPATRLFHSPRLDSFIIAIIGCKIKIDLDVVKERLFSAVSNIPRFSSVMVKDEKSGKMKWRLTKMNVEEHVFCPEVDYNMKEADEFVQDYISRLTAKPMDLISKPLWELHLLNVKTSDANGVGIFRIHHSMGDGITLISVLLACTRKTSDPECLPSIPGRTSKSAKSSSPITRFFYAIWMIIVMIYNTVVDVTLVLATMLYLKDTETPLKGGPGIERTHKRIMHRTVSLVDIKLVKNAMNATINDVIVGVTQAGLSRYLNRRYASNNDQTGHRASEKTNNLPKGIRIRASLIFNIRPYAGLQVLADMMKRKSKAKWGSKIGYALLPLRLALRDDPLIYIREAQSMINRKKLSLESRFSYAAVKILLQSLGQKSAAALTHKVLFNTTICLSNVVGPQEEVSFYGHPLSYIAPSVHGLPHALLIHYQSYVDKMTIVLTYDPSVILDPHLLFDDIEESLNIIKDAVIKRGIVKGTAEP